MDVTAEPIPLPRQREQIRPLSGGMHSSRDASEQKPAGRNAVPAAPAVLPVESIGVNWRLIVWLARYAAVVLTLVYIVTDPLQGSRYTDMLMRAALGGFVDLLGLSGIALVLYRVVTILIASAPTPYEMLILRDRRHWTPGNLIVAAPLFVLNWLWVLAWVLDARLFDQIVSPARYLLTGVFAFLCAFGLQRAIMMCLDIEREACRLHRLHEPHGPEPASEPAEKHRSLRQPGRVQAGYDGRGRGIVVAIVVVTAVFVILVLKGGFL